MTHMQFVATFLFKISTKELHAATLTMPPDALNLTSEDNIHPSRCSKPPSSKSSSTGGSGPSATSGWPYPLPYHTFGMLPHGFPMPNATGNLSIPGMAPGIPAPSASMTHSICELSPLSVDVHNHSLIYAL